MPDVWRRGIVGTMAVALILCVLVVFISPAISSFPTHLKPKRTFGKLLGQFIQTATAVESLHTSGHRSAGAVTFAQRVTTTPVLQLLCVRIC